MIQAGMEMGPNTPYGQYIRRSSSKWYGLYHSSRHFCLSKVINNNKKWDVQVNRWVCVDPAACCVCRDVPAQVRRGSEAARRGREEVCPKHRHPLPHTPPKFLRWGVQSPAGAHMRLHHYDVYDVFVSRLFHIVFRSFTGRAQDVVEQTLGLGHRSFQTEKSPWGGQWGQSEFWNRAKKETVVQRQTFKCAL